jgi:hypothetical protein
MAKLPLTATADRRIHFRVAGVNHALLFSLAATRFAISRPRGIQIVDALASPAGPPQSVNQGSAAALINVRGL